MDRLSTNFKDIPRICLGFYSLYKDRGLGKSGLCNLALATISGIKITSQQNTERSMFVNQMNTIRYVKPNDSH